MNASERKVAQLSTDLQESKTEIRHLRNELNYMKIEHDDLENYGRRLNVRIEGIEFEREETQDDLYNKVKTALGEVDIAIKKTHIVRFHRSSKPVRNRNGKLVAQTIVKFARWEHRRQAHFANKRAREKRLSFWFHNDLSKRCYKLLTGAREMISNRPPADENGQNNDSNLFAYADVNSNLKIRYGHEVRDINSEDDIQRSIRELYG